MADAKWRVPGFARPLRVRMKLVASAFVWNKIKLTVVIVKAFQTTKLSGTTA